MKPKSKSKSKSISTLPLVLPTPPSGAAAIKAVTPPIKQADLIEALVARSRQKQRADAEAAAEAAAAAEVIFTEALIELFRQEPENFAVNCSPMYGQGRLTLDVATLSPALKKLRSACHVPGPGYFDEKRVRAEIKEGLNGQASRVAAMLGDTHVVGLLDDTLDALKNAAKKLSA
jgi:hypothetical protein